MLNPVQIARYRKAGFVAVEDVVADQRPARRRWRALCGECRDKRAPRPHNDTQRWSPKARYCASEM